MTVSVTSPAPPDGTGQRHRVVAIGFGFVGLIAAKALKHAQLNITDALVFLVRFTAQGTSHLVNQPSVWAEVIPANGAIATTMGMLVALCVAAADKRGKSIAAQSGSWWASRIDHAGVTVTTWRASAQDSVTAASDSLRHRGLRHSRQIAKGWL
jgi:succinate dehydrogenase/fumarate reductase flavoprotein subunit